MPNSAAESRPKRGSPALSMKMAPFRLGTTKDPLENEPTRAGCRPGITKSAGEPLNGTVSSELFVTLRIAASSKETRGQAS